jgi:hypothetical protein
MLLVILEIKCAFLHLLFEIVVYIWRIEKSTLGALPSLFPVVQANYIYRNRD